VLSDAEVTAAEIARLAGVGRAAVSNWRKRFADFPQPVGGTPASPAYRLSEVEAWLRANDRLAAETPMGALWLAIQHAGAQAGSVDQAILQVGHLLLGRSTARIKGKDAVSPDLRKAVVGAANQADGGEVFEHLLERHLDLQSRRGMSATPPALAGLMVKLANVVDATVLDPACGTGWLLHAAASAGAAQVMGQDNDADVVALADVRLELAGAKHQVRTGSLREDAFADTRAEVVLCDPPYGQRDWGYDELTFDTRWEYEVPPRSEPELAWVQHGLARLKPGGRAVMVLPPAVASRPTGRRVRNALVRRGALRAVVALPPGASTPAHLPLHLWLLSRPEQPGTPKDLLMVDASGRGWPGCAGLVTQVVTTYEKNGEVPPEYADTAAAVPLLDLIDDGIDLTPARHLAQNWLHIDAAAVRAQRQALASLIEALPALLPDLPDEPPPLATTRTVAVADLVRNGQISMHNPLDTAVREGDVLVQTVGPRPRAAVVRDPVAAPMLDGPYMLVRPDRDRLDPWFLTGFIAREANVRLISSLGSSRLDLRRARLPHLPLDQQREYGLWFERLDAFDRAVGDLLSMSTEVVHLMAESLATGALGGRP
jgi:SAM-dependent methyltransferase/predicted DNA-binding transcriptional regulator AlpA